MVVRSSSSDIPPAILPAESPHIPASRRIICSILAISLAIPPGTLRSEPAGEVPLEYFAQADTPESPPPAGGGNASPAPDPEDPASWKPGDPTPPAPHDGQLSPPDGVPVQAPFPVDGQPQAQPGIPLETGNCVITGEVSDSTSLNPVAGAIIDAIGTGRSAETDASGRFRIDALPPGSYTLEASKLGYHSETTVITAIEAQPAEARFGLRLKPTDDNTDITTLEEEVVVGEYTESQGDFNLDLTADVSSVTSGISKDDFTKTGVSDAAAAVGKVAGANIVGGKFAVVRGLADRYVTTLFNGAAISSADPSRKAVQLDIFPTTAIQGIDINKTYTPDLPGDFGGGTIKIRSLNIPNERFAEFKYKLTGNSNLDDRMLVHPNRDLGYWGDVNKPIPDSLMWNLDQSGNPATFNAGGNRITPGNTNNASQRQAQINAALAQQQLADESLPKQKALHESQDFLPKETEPEPEESHSLVYGDKFTFENGNEFGFVGAYQHTTSDEVNAFGEENRLTSPARSWTEESYSREVDWSLYLAAGLRIGENHQIDATYFRKRIAADEIKHGTGFRIQGDGVYGAFAKNSATIPLYGASAVYNKEFWTIDPVVRDTELSQISGHHKNNHGTTLSWGLTRSTASESRPHTSTFQNGELDFTDPRIALEAARDPSFVYNPSLGKISTIQYQSFVNDGIGSLDSSRETQSIEETANEASVDLGQTIYLTDDREDGERIELSFGANKLEKERVQEGRIYLLRTASWERWVARNPPSWWSSNSGITPFSPGSPLNGTTLADGSPLPAGFNSLGEYLASNPQALADYFNGYGNENFGGVPGTGSSSTRANYVQPDAPYYLNGSGLEVRNVDSNLTLTALYASGTFHADFWRFGGGARWEEETKDYQVAADPLTSLQPDDPARSGSLTTNAFIPALYGGIDVVPDQSWLNFAWSRTVARPTFHEFLPIESVSQDTGILRRGNPNLSETSIENLDASLDWTFSESLSGTVSLFRKVLSDPIVVVQQVDQGVNSVTYVNGDSGHISGIELEGRWKSPAFPFSLTGNYTYISSTLDYEVNQGINVTPLETRFPFQPSQILNLTLGWEPVDSPWSAFLTANFTDEYPTVLRSEPSAYDVWLNPNLTLDFLLARRFEFDSYTASVTLGVKNITGAVGEYEYRGGSPGGNNGPLNGLVYSENDPGISYYIQFKADF